MTFLNYRFHTIGKYVQNYRYRLSTDMANIGPIPIIGQSLPGWNLWQPPEREYIPRYSYQVTTSTQVFLKWAGIHASLLTGRIIKFFDHPIQGSIQGQSRTDPRPFAWTLCGVPTLSQNLWWVKRFNSQWRAKQTGKSISDWICAPECIHHQ